MGYRQEEEKKFTGYSNVSNIEKCREMIFLIMLGWLLLRLLIFCRKKMKGWGSLIVNLRKGVKVRGHPCQHFETLLHPEDRKCSIGPGINEKSSRSPEWMNSQTPQSSMPNVGEDKGIWTSSSRQEGSGWFKISSTSSQKSSFHTSM